MEAGRIYDKGGRYTSLFYRRWVPLGLRDLLGLKEIRIPLGTPDRREAERLLPKMDQQVGDELDRLRQKVQRGHRTVDVELIRQAATWAEADVYNHYLDLLQLGLLSQDARVQIDPDELFEKFQASFSRRILDRQDRAACMQAIAGGAERAKTRLEEASRSRRDTYASQPLPAVTTTTPTTRILLDTLVERYKSHNTLGRKAPGEIALAVRRLKEFFEKDRVYADELTPVGFREFRDLLRQCPVMYVGRGKTPPLRELAKMPGEKVANATVNKTTTWIAAIYSFGLREALIGSNPCLGLSSSLEDKAKNPRLTYRDAEAKTVLDRLETIRQTNPTLYWVTRIASLIGARREEICQLRRPDIFQEDEVWCFDMHEIGPNQLKNEASARHVPIPEVLIRDGLLQYIEGRDDLVFDVDLVRGFYGEQVGKDYAEFVAPLNLRRGLDFHSWRHTFKTKCRRVEMPEEIHKRLVGHTDKSASSGYGEFPIRTLKGWIDRISY